MEIAILVLRWLHIFSAITMVGSVFYARFAVLPLLESLPEDQSDAVDTGLRKHWAKFIHGSIGLLLLTGIANMAIALTRYDFTDKSYGMLLMVKFLLALGAFFIVSVLNGRSENAEKFRAKRRMWLNVTVVLVVVIVCLAGYLKSFERSPKEESAGSPARLAQSDVQFAGSCEDFRCSPRWLG